MTRTVLILPAIALLGLASPAVAQTCSDDIEPTAPLVRYELHDDGTVTDRRTGLRWQRCPVGYTLDDAGTALDYTDDSCDAAGTPTVDWQDALQAAETVNTGGGLASFNDWRLPNIKELVSTVEYRCASPAVNAAVFPDTPSAARFWSSTIYIYNDTAAVLDVAEGQNSTAPKEGAGSENHVRLVR